MSEPTLYRIVRNGDHYELMPVEATTERRFGTEVWPEDYDEPVRPIWKVIEVRIPEGEITAAKWNGMTVSERRDFLSAGIGDNDE